MVRGSKKGAAPGFSAGLGQRIEHVVNELGGVAAAAGRLGRSKDTIARWRHGVSRIALADIIELAGAAGVDPAWLAFGRGAAGVGADAVPLNAIRDAWDFWMPVILRLRDRPEPAILRERFLSDVVERAARR